MKTTEQNQKVNNKVFVKKEMDTKFQALLPKRIDSIFFREPYRLNGINGMTDFAECQVRIRK